MKSDSFLERKKEYFNKINIITESKVIKICKLIDPIGNIYYSNNGLKSFCKENNIDYNGMKRVSCKKQKEFQGWKIME